MRDERWSNRTSTMAAQLTKTRSSLNLVSRKELAAASMGAKGRSTRSYRRFEPLGASGSASAILT
jgi:hypothetical protein